MRSLTIASVTLILFSCTSVLGQEKGLARPEKFYGVPVYVMSDPVEEYEVVGRVNTGFTQVARAISSESSAEALSIRALTQKLVRKAQRKAKKGKLPQFDAILTEEGDYGTLIRFQRALE